MDHGKVRNLYKIRARKSEGMRPVGRPRCIREDKGYDEDWIQLAQDGDRLRALVNVIVNLSVPYEVWNALTC
jgi:hypothetical protein